MSLVMSQPKTFSTVSSLGASAHAMSSVFRSLQI
jgi:hypothetical protein